MLVALIMMFEAVVFFVLYSHMPTSLNFFAIHNVETSLLGLEFEPEQFQALNPFWIMLASPLLAAGYNRLGDRLPMPFKFAIGMVLAGLPGAAAGCTFRQRCRHSFDLLAHSQLCIAKHR